MHDPLKAILHLAVAELERVELPDKITLIEPGLRQVPIFQGFPDNLQRPHEVDRFGEICVHPGIETPLLVLFAGVCGQGDDGDVSPKAALLLPYGDCGLEAVLARHLHVHKNEVECPAFPHFHSPLSVLGEVYLIFGSREHASQHLPDGRIVLGDE